MSLEKNTAQGNRTYQFLIITGIILISVNLRAAITSVGPLIEIIREDLALTSGSIGLITSIPLIAFSVMSPFAAKIGNRFSYEGALLIGLCLLLFGITIRSISVIILLFTGTFFVGLGIAILNVLLPGVIKDKFPLKVGLLTSIYTTTMGIVASLATGISVPLAVNAGLGWQRTLLIWSIPAVVGIIIWFILLTKNKQEKAQNQTIKYAPQPKGNQIWRSKLAWQIAAFMGFQSFLFYVTISWLPAILHFNGMSQESAGWMLSFSQFIGLPASFLVPVIAEKMKSTAPIIWSLSLAIIIGYAGILITNSFPIVIICAILIGLALSGLFALALTLLAIRTRTSRDAAELSGMAQSVGYVIAATGPILIGALFDLFDSWNVSILTIITVAVIVLFFGILISKERYLYEE